MYTMISKLCLLLFFINGLLQYGAALGRPTTMVLENNQYKNMVIAFHESVAEDKKLIDTLKTVMTKASETLMKATRNRAYFKDITILLPSTWSDDSSYQSATTETVNLADVIISDTSRSARSLPQTRSYNGCGKPGVHILLPVDFLTKPRAEPYFLMPEKYFIHAFAQFRWGVYQEYAETGETLFYFSLTSGRAEAIRCVYYLRGLIQKNDVNQTICYSSIDAHTGLYTSDCLWRPYPTHQRAKASMMDHQWISAIETFCDDTTSYLTVHNYEAPSKHNRLCGHRSTWDVISNSDDFVGNKNPPVTNLSPSALVPTFKIVKSKTRRKRAVIVIDDDHQEHGASIDKIIGRLKHEVKHHGIEIISQSSSEYGIPNMQANIEKRDINEDHVIHVQNECKPVPLGVSNAVVTVISAKNATCLVHADKVNHMVQGNLPGHTLIDRLRQAILMDNRDDGKYTLIKHAQICVQPAVQYTDDVSVDQTVGQKTQFVFYYENNTPDIVIHSPSGQAYARNNPEYFVEEQTKLVKFYFENAEAGIWRYSIKSQDTTNQTITAFISSTPTTLDHDPLIVRTAAETVGSDYSHIVLHVDVTQGTHLVVGLNVTATVETPSGQMETIQLCDNGAGADVTKNDGIYSRYYTKAIVEGTYHFTAHVTGKDGEVFALEEMYIKPDIIDNEQEDIPLHRVINKRSLVGEIQRQVTMNSVYQPAAMLINDTTPPSRVVDLKAVRHLYYRNTLALSWTAPGDDLDSGKVEKYELFVGQDIKDIRALLKSGSEFEYEGPGNIIKEEKDAVAMATETETLLWTIPPSVHTFAFSVRGIDSHGNKAEMSNVATFGFELDL